MHNIFVRFGNYTSDWIVDVEFVIFNQLGLQVEKVVHGNYPAGKQKYIWDASGFPDGIYFVHVRAGQEMVAGKIVKIR